LTSTTELRDGLKPAKKTAKKDSRPGPDIDTILGRYYPPVRREFAESDREDDA